MNVIERFLTYAKMDTCSDSKSKTYPTTEKQRELAKLLAKELEEMGAADVLYDTEYGYVFATVPASEGCEDVPVIGFIAHIDTVGNSDPIEVKPRIVENYDGGDVVLNEELNIILSPDNFSELKKLAGKDLIVTDGTTVLGADDKAGVAEIMCMAEYLLNHPEVKHGKIRVAFTPDEESVGGTKYFDLDLFGCSAAYTVDGAELGELQYENFNSANGSITVHGIAVHTGFAKGKMKNAVLIAQEFQSMLPVFENPMYTEGREGYYHLSSINGNVAEIKANYLFREHDFDKLQHMKALFEKAVEFLNFKYGEGTVEFEIRDRNKNMGMVLKDHMYLIDNAIAVMKELGIEPLVRPIRGATDGTVLTFKGLPCPNICTGGGNFHSKYEYACVQSMEKIVELLVGIAAKFAE